MNEERQTFTIKRILVALDASSHSLAALQAATELAVRFQAELSGLFVEDENLLRLAELPFLQEVGLFSGTRRYIDRTELERQMRVQSHHVQSVFTMTTQHTQITKTFHVVQGSVLSEVLTAASQADMLVLGKAGRSLLRRGQLGSTVRGILPKHFGLTLILKEGACLGTRLAVVYDGSPAANRALLAASQLGGQTDNDETLIVLLLAENERKAQKLHHQAASCLADGDTVLRFRWLTGDDMPRIAAILQTETCGVLVLPVRSFVLQNDLLVTFLEQLDMPIFLVN